MKINKQKIWQKNIKYVTILLFLYINLIFMTKTKTKKVIASLAILSLSLASLSFTNMTTNAAIKIGTGSVTSSWAMNTDIMWDETYTNGSASATITGVKVIAKIEPTLNMAISNHEINLGNLTPGIESTWSLDLEIWTNAADWVKVTAISTTAGLTNKDDSNIQINNLTTDWAADSYTYKSTAWTSDSTVTGFSVTTLTTATEINDKTTEHTIYQSNKPEAFDATADATFEVAANANAQTPAWEYEDIITFTITGNF